jgi:DNA invertase Pin-like site-specific DNA recombinase
MRAALYARVSTPEQSLDNQLIDLRRMAKTRGYEIVREYTDVMSGTKAKRPGLTDLLRDARKKRFDAIFVAAFDRVARSTKNFLELIDELNDLGIEFASAREAIDTSGPMGRMFVTLIGSIAELERSLIVERIRAGMRRAKLEGRRLGRLPLDVNRAGIVHDRATMSLTQVAKKHGVSRATVVRLVRESQTGVDSQQLVVAAKSLSVRRNAVHSMSL